MLKVIYVLCVLVLCATTLFGQGGSNIRLLIARPNNFDYTADSKTEWISAIVESFLFFRLDAIDRVRVISVDQISEKVSSHRNFSKRVGKSKYISAGKALLATSIVYTEYEAKGSNVILHISVIDPASGKGKDLDVTIPLGDMNPKLTESVREIASLSGVAKNELNESFYNTNLLGTDSKNSKRLGDFIVLEQKGGKSNFKTIANNCEEITSSDNSMYLAYYAGSRLYAKASKSEGALRLINALVNKFKNQYPKLNLKLATYYRKSGDVNKAKSAIDKLENNSNLRNAVLFEKGLIYAAMGKHSVSFETFKKLESIDKNDPVIYTYLAKSSIALRKTNAVDGYITKVASLSGRSKGAIYFEIANAFKSDKNETNAIAAYEKCLEMESDHLNAWLALGNIQLAGGKDSIAATCFITLFKLDYTKYDSYLEKGAKLLEKKGHKELARQVYSEAFDRHRDPKIAVLLAKLEFAEGNYIRTTELLQDLSAPYNRDSEVIAMLEKVREDKVPPVLKLIGANPMNINTSNGRYVEPGARATDKVDGDLTVSIEIKANVRSSKAGTYTVTYKVQDYSRNETKITRTVIVTDDGPPVGQNLNLDPGSDKKRAGKQQTPQIASLLNKKKSRRKPILGIISGFGIVGGGVMGILFNKTASKYQDEFNELKKSKKIAATTPAKDSITIIMQDKKDKGESAMLFRNLGYALSGTFGIVFVINIVIPSRKD